MKKINKTKQNNVKLKQRVRILLVGFCGVLCIAGLSILFNKKAIAQITSFLIHKAGFVFLDAPDAEYLYFKQTDNYTAYAGDKGEAQLVQTRLAVGEQMLDLALLGAYETAPNESTSSADVVPSVTKDPNDAKAVLERIRALSESIEHTSTELIQRADETRQAISGLHAPARLADETQERVVVYENVRPGMDIRYRLNEGGITEEIVLKDAQVRYAQYYYSLYMRELVATDIGKNVWYLSTKDGGHVFRFPRGWAKDKTGAFTNAVLTDIDGGLMKKTVDPSWLYAPERAFPIVITNLIDIVPEMRLDASRSAKRSL